ncbi:MAG: hypothetical protein LBO09_05030 [Candidatus Peribacteria bacterium]|jgi:hypothetical protein|nr:hypothetical protein [Candidatus Peribacteria bacterium]
MYTTTQQEIVSTSAINPIQLPKADRHNVDQRKKQKRLAYQEWKETKAINDNGAFIIENTQDSLLANNNIYTKQMKLIKEKGKQYLIDNFHALAEYEHPLAERHNEIMLTADGEGTASPVVIPMKKMKKSRTKYALAS